jgi:hypothetical protein
MMPAQPFVFSQPLPGPADDNPRQSQPPVAQAISENGNDKTNEANRRDVIHVTKT